jgi:signal transduction histidine kinase
MSRRLGAQAAAPSNEALRVLLADDAADIRLLLRRSLEHDGSVQVIGEACNGAEAVRMAERIRPDVVLIDLAMPVLDGLQAIPQIRQRSPDTEIVVLSGFNGSVMEEKAIDAGAAAFVSKTGGPDAILAALRGVGHRERAAAPIEPDTELLEAARQVDQDLIPMLSHEIGNQLTVIQGFAEMLLDGIGNGLPSATARQFADSIVRNAKHMSGLLEAVSEVRKLDLGAVKLEVADVDVAALLREATPDLVDILGGRPLTLDLEQEAVVPADPARIRQVLSELLSNASTFTPPTTVVTVAVRAVDDGVEVSVADDGPGVPDDQHGRLFQMFGRLNANTKGTGMGLYMAKAIARAHGGDLVFVPANPGCRFILHLPNRAAAGE